VEAKMNLQCKHLSILGWTLVLLLVATSCSSPSTPGDEGGALEGSINCHAFYRAASGEALAEAPIMTLSMDGDLEFIQFENMEFRVQFFADQFEGQSLSISITNMDNNTELNRYLYQLDQSKGLSNQFIGGHGFTGLNYIFHPEGEAEMQFFCEVG
jgi:hypothetical protein